MNKRIKLLADQAGAFYASGFEEVPSEFCLVDDMIEKFAQLIVQECATIVNSLDQYESGGDCVTASYIKDQFGVK